MKLKLLILCVFYLSLRVNTVPLQERQADTSKCGYSSCHPVSTNPEILNVHLVPHTHDDVGWLKTVDQYYFGSRGNIQKASVQYIIDSVVESLIQSSDRRFVYVESAFFSKWWDEQDDSLKEQVKMLVNEGRLEFIGGAWSMNDEATTHYQSIVDQFTLGTQFLNDTFGECARPRVGWQIDPFGHSREQASLFAKMGYDGFFFARLDYQDKNKRLSEKNMEMVWEASENLDDADIFTGALYSHYSPPSGFCFDVLCNDEPIIDDPKSADYNVDSRVNDFVNWANTQASRYRTKNIILTMGDDFHFMNANLWFKNLDKLIKYTNERQNDLKLNVLYSTPSCYLKALHDTNIQWPTKTDDFFPYANDPHAFWTGYFTSRPTSKRYERVGNQFLQICKQLTASANLTSSSDSTDYEDNLARMKHIMGVMQHHDAVTGTEKQHVADDYHREMHASFEACEENTKVSLNHFVSGDNLTSSMEFNFESCLMLNISDCAVTERSERFIVNVYNPLAQTSNQYVRFPISGYTYEVHDTEDSVVSSNFVPIPTSVKNIFYREANAAHELVFQASDIPPLGYKSYHVKRTTTALGSSNEATPTTNPVTIGNDNLKITFDANGLLSQITVDGETSPLAQNFWLYKGARGDNRVFENRSSGAYIFRPDPAEGDARQVTDKATIAVFEGELVDEVHQIFNEWISQVVRIYKEENFVEFEWLVGPIPVDDEVGKEIITRFVTPMNTNAVFETDSNGREMLTRHRDVRETWDIALEEFVSGNYYPINSKIAIEDNTHRLAVLNDRAQGGSSILDGTVELMVHRRCLNDDAFGVAEALNEQAYGQGLIARGKHWLIFGRKSTQSPTLEARERLLQNRVLLSNWLFFDSVTAESTEWMTKYNGRYSAIGKELPENIYLMSYEPWNENSYLIRFEHILEKNEDPELSKPVSFNLTEVFPMSLGFYETTLAGNQWLADSNRLHFNKEGTTAKSLNEKTSTVASGKSQTALASDVITLNPMEMRTFIMEMKFYKPTENHGIKSQNVFILFPVIVLASILKNFL